MKIDYAPRRGLGRGVLAAVLLPPAVLLALTVVASRAGDIPLGLFSRDPTATLNANPLTGVQSQLGVLVWWAGASISFFAGAVLHRARRDRTLVEFLRWSASITAVLTLDDLFQFHEDLAERYFGLNDAVVVVVYGLAVLVYLVRFRRVILRSQYVLLVAGLTLFAGSNLVDALLQDRWMSEWRIFLEDGFKLFGIVNWSAFLILTSLEMMTRSDDGATAGAVGEETRTAAGTHPRRPGGGVDRG
jgi:hypothetical protein